MNTSTHHVLFIQHKYFPYIRPKRNEGAQKQMEIMIVLYYMMLAYLLCANVLAIYCYIHICINDNVSPLHNISNVLTMGCKMCVMGARLITQLQLQFTQQTCIFFIIPKVGTNRAISCISTLLPQMLNYIPNIVYLTFSCIF